MSFAIVVQDPNQVPDTMVGLFETVEEAQEYMRVHNAAFSDLEMTIANEWEGEGDIPPVQAFIVFMNPRQDMMSESNQSHEAATKRAERAEAQVKNVLKLCEMLEKRDNSSWQHAMAASFRNAIADVT